MEHLHMKTRTQQIEELNKEWTNPRWEGITRPYSAEEVVKLRGSVNPECTLAQLGSAITADRYCFYIGRIQVCFL